ncbi:MAG: class I SAM-dependent RNA methyltransferase [Puniceicoccales bacterium]|jgi:23S rRNA (uracil1939-C5)-methyltransferase/tRNA (uracil-5-)-methyltransferase|nr:class I SAM-dependent RNA methyltransferase [Puniceicoccales bacterium]
MDTKATPYKRYKPCQVFCAPIFDILSFLSAKCAEITSTLICDFHLKLQHNSLLVEAVNSSGKNFVPIPFEYHREIELKITDITNLGIGIGRVNNWVVMVPNVCIDEVVIGRIYKNSKNYSLADLVKILQQSTDRINPRCKLAGVCGGCQYQHISYPAQLSLKKHQVEDAMRRLGGIQFPVNNCIHGDLQYNYRTKVTPHFQKSVPAIGFLKCGGKNIVDVGRCEIATENINNKLPLARGEVFAKKNSLKKGGTLLLRDLGTNVVTNPREIVTQSIGDFKFSFSAGEFFQNNASMLPQLVDFVKTAASGPKYLVDTYCGVGVFGIVAASNFQNVVGIEISEIATVLAKENAKKNNLSNIEFITGSAEKIFQNIEFQGHETSVIIDPPRSGCTENFLRQLISFSPQKITYVSCAPDTQARDLKILSKCYSITKIQPFDMFPQTRHVENVVVLVKTQIDA